MGTTALHYFLKPNLFESLTLIWFDRDIYIEPIYLLIGLLIGFELISSGTEFSNDLYVHKYENIYTV